MFRIIWNPQASKQLQKLPLLVARRIHDKIGCAVADLFRYLERLEGSGVYKLRIGDYRALIDIDFKESVLLVQDIDHRSRIYKH